MNINYKYISVILSILFVLALIPMFSFWHRGDMKEGKYGSEKMHMMQDGRMMRGDKDMGHMNMDSMMMDMTANMKNKSGTELEKAFIADMILHHQGAVDMAKLLLQDKTVRPELVKFADGIIAAQEAEIVTMKTWLKDWSMSTQ